MMRRGTLVKKLAEKVKLYTGKPCGSGMVVIPKIKGMRALLLMTSKGRKKLFQMLTKASRYRVMNPGMTLGSPMRH